VQKFTRALTREIELAGQRLKVTLDEKGIAVSPVGSRRPPREISWAALAAQLGTSETVAEPAPEALTAAIESLKGGTTARKPAKTAAPAESSPPREDLSPLLTRLEAWLKVHRPRYAEALQPPATEDDYVALRGSLGAPVPDDLRQLLAWHDGQGEDFSGSFEEAWNLLSAAQIGAAKRDLDSQAGHGQSTWQPAWVPFLDDDQGNYLCLDPSLPGVPVREYRLTSPEAPTVAASLAAWLADFVAAVEAGQYHEDSERGQFIKRRA
jgi:cell wall assembly regulator SMI1